MGYKVGDIVKLLPFLDMCRMGKVKYGFGITDTVVLFPNKRSYTLQDLKRVGGKQGKIIGEETDKTGVLYTVQWKDGKMDTKFQARPFLIESKVLSIVKCEVEEMDRYRRKFELKQKAAKQRKEDNDKITKPLKKGKKK